MTQMGKLIRSLQGTLFVTCLLRKFGLEWVKHNRTNYKHCIKLINKTSTKNRIYHFGGQDLAKMFANNSIT